MKLEKVNSNTLGGDPIMPEAYSIMLARDNETVETSPQAPSNEKRAELASRIMQKLGYARVSTANEEQTSSLDSQKRRLKEYGCSQIFSDRASGGSLDRPGWRELKAAALERSKREQTQVIVCSPERLSRDQIQLILLIEGLENAGIEILSLDSGRISVESPENRLTWAVLGASYEFARRASRDKVLRSKAAARAQGRKLGGVDILGYTWNGSLTQRIPDPETWGIARELVDRYLDENGQGLPGLSKWLREEHGISRTASGLLTWLRSPVLRGHSSHRIIAGRKESLIVPNTHAPLISPDEARGLDLKLGRNRAFSGRRTPMACSRLCRCASCGVLLSLCNDGRPRKSTGIPYFYFRCKAGRQRGKPCPHKGGVPYDSVEPLVLEAIVKRAEDIAKAALEPPEKVEDPRTLRLEADLAQLEAVFKSQPLQTIEEAMMQVEREIAYLKSQKSSMAAENQDFSDLVTALADPNFWDGLDEVERNRLYLELGTVVWCQGRLVLGVELGYTHRPRRKTTR